MAAKRILVVDDEAPIRILLKETLAEAGYDVATAADGNEALESLSTCSRDILITDLDMPYMGGVQLFQQVKQQWPGMIVIVLTGHATLESAAEALHSGCDDYLFKPMPTVGLVLHSIDRCLARRRSLAEIQSLQRISKAKGEVLDITWEELSASLAEARECLDQIQEANGKGDMTAISLFAEDAKESLNKACTVLSQLERVKAALEKTPGRQNVTPCKPDLPSRQGHNM